MSGRSRIEESEGNLGAFIILVVVSLLLLQYAASLSLVRSLRLAVFTDTIQLVLALFATAVFLKNSFHSAGPIRLFWALFATSWGILCCSQFVWIYFDVVVQRQTSNPFLGDVLLFLSCTPVLAALFLQAHPQSWAQQKKSGFVDFVLLVLWWLYLYLFFVAPWELVEVDAARYGTSYNRLEALGDVGILLLVVYLIKRRPGVRRRFYLLLFSAQALFAITGYLMNSAIDRGVYYPGSWYDVPFTTALGLFTVVGLVGRPLTQASDDLQTSSDFPLARWGMFSLLSLPVITAVTLFTQTTSLRVLRFRELVVQGTILAMGLLIFTRQRALMFELAQSARVLEQASVTDSLTGCHNRRFLDVALPADASQALRSYQSGAKDRASDLVFYLIDLDNFKEINDRYGHNTGDLVLVEVAMRIKSVIRKSDVLVRWGGDEFLILSRQSSRLDAPAMCRRILLVMQDPIPRGLTGISNIRQTCSIGWAAYPWSQDRPGDLEVENVLACTDRALYHAKRSGKNTFIGISAYGPDGAVFGKDQAGDGAEAYNSAHSEVLV